MENAINIKNRVYFTLFYISKVEFFILTNTHNNKHSTIPITPLLNEHSKILIWKKNYYQIQNLRPVFYLAANINNMILPQQQKY